MSVPEGVNNLLLLKNNVYSESIWLECMVDALILDQIQSAVKDGNNPIDYINHLNMMILERSMEWIVK